jgi:HAD superfamily hydrolase (TIGR01509 family)
MKYQAIIFDMDGTITDTEHIWHRASCELMSRRGITITPDLKEEIAQQLNGCALNQSCAIIKDLGKFDDPVEDLIQEKKLIASHLYKDNLQFIEGFLSFHQHAKQLNLKTGIATNADDTTLALTKQILKLEELFGQHVYNISYVNNKGKPDPAIYLYTARQLNIEPTSCIAIEDSSRGIKAAKEAGMFCIGITTTKRPSETKDAHLIIDAYAQINLIKLLREQ